MKCKTRKVHKTCFLIHNFLYFCTQRELLGGNTLHITEFETVSKSLPRLLRNAISSLFLIYSCFNIVFFDRRDTQNFKMMRSNTTVMPELRRLQLREQRNEVVN